MNLRKSKGVEICGKDWREEMRKLCNYIVVSEPQNPKQTRTLM